jgi:hypothetical protein
MAADQPIELEDGLFYIPRGLVWNFEGRTLAFLGGGESLDQYVRKPAAKEEVRRTAHHWFPEERIQPSDVRRLVRNVGGSKIDAFVTHVPPASIITAAYGNLAESIKEGYYLPKEWVDESAIQVEMAYQQLMSNLGEDGICVFGHMHQSKTFLNFRGLGKDEAWSPQSWCYTDDG